MILVQNSLCSKQTARIPLQGPDRPSPCGPAGPQHWQEGVHPHRHQRGGLCEHRGIGDRGRAGLTLFTYARCYSRRSSLSQLSLALARLIACERGQPSTACGGEDTSLAAMRFRFVFRTQPAPSAACLAPQAGRTGVSKTPPQTALHHRQQWFPTHNPPTAAADWPTGTLDQVPWSAPNATDCTSTSQLHTPHPLSPAVKAYQLVPQPQLLPLLIPPPTHATPSAAATDLCKAHAKCAICNVPCMTFG